MEELQTCYQIPSIAHFCYLFGDCLNLPKFDYEDLEFAFLSNICSDNYDIESNESNLLLKLICKLLNGYFSTHINHTNWEKYLQKLFEIQWVNIEKRRSPFVGFDDDGEDIIISFDDLPLRTKADVIHCLCDYRLYGEDINQKVNDINADDFRVQPFGTDNEGYIYWYFNGTRLYRENPSVAQRIEEKYKKLETELKKKKGKPIAKKGNPSGTPKKEVQRKGKSLPPKVLGSRTGLRERKTESVSVPNGVCSQKTVVKTVPKIDSNNNSKESKEVTIDERKEGWTLICQTEQDWKDLIEKFSKSKIKCESDLYKHLNQLFKQNIIQYFVDKEKEKQKVERKIFVDLLPRRLSSRIELKKIQREKEEIEQEEVRRKQEEDRRKQEELNNRDADRQRSERVKQEREIRAQKRLQLLEERTDRIKRERVVNGEDGLEEGLEDKDQNMETNDFDYINEEFINTSVKPTDNIETFYEGLEKVITKVKSNRDAWPFAEAVDGIKFPMYYQVITQPMDLSIISNKIQKRDYKVFEEIENDFKLMVNNCETFNGPKNGYTLMAYGVWRAFKRASLKYLERELTYNESTAFIYPQKVTNTNIMPAIEAKKKKLMGKRRSTFKALNVLAEAAEKAVEANESRVVRIPASVSSSYGESSPNSNVSNDSNTFSLKETPNQVESSLRVHGDMWANFLCNANNSNSTKETNDSNSCQQIAANSTINENLTFKSLDEWSKSIKQSGNCVVLPQHAVIISSPKFIHCTNGPVVTSPGISLKVVSNVNPGTDSTSNVNNNTNSSQVFTSSVISNNENNKKESVNTDPKRLVIKLSRCEAQQVWRPVTLITSTAQNNFSTNCLQSYGQTITTTAQQFQGLRTIPTNCVPVKKRFVIKDFDKQSIAEQKPSMILNTSPIKQNSNSNSPSFQITGIQTNQNTNLKVFHLKKLDQTSTLYHSNVLPTASSSVVPKLLLIAPKEQTQNANNSSSESGLS